MSENTVRQERANIRRQQARAVMPLIGLLLDAWDELPNDVKVDPELFRISKCIYRIDCAMEGDPQ